MTFPLVRTLLACSTLVAASVVASAARADDTLYKCVDEHGNTTFTNTGSTKGCTKLNVDPVVIPKLVTPTKQASTPSGFPKVDSSTQKARDNDRRRILEDELHDKENQLAQLKQEYNNGEPERQGNERNYQRYLDRRDQLKQDIARAENDIASIRNEISKVQ